MAGIRRYEKLFTVEVIHEYYASGNNTDIAIEPTASCLKTLQNYNLLQQKNEQSRIGIYCETSGSSSSRLQPTKPINQPIKLSFLLYLRNNNFLNFSEISGTPVSTLQEGKMLFYFNNLELTTGLLKSSTLLTNNALGTVSHQDSIKLLPAIFNIPTRTSRCIRVVLPQSQSVPVTVKTFDNFSHGQPLAINWRGYSAGLYEIQWLLSVNPVQIEHREVVYIDQSLFAKRPFAILELYVDRSFMNNNSPNFQIQFARREAQWVYIIVDKNNSIESPNDQTIKYNMEMQYPNNVIFQKLDSAVYLTDEQRAVFQPASVYVFKADKPLPSYEVPLKNLTINLKNGAGMNLPSLSQQALKPEIFIHL